MLCSVQSLSRVRLFATPWTAACQASLPILCIMQCTLYYTTLYYDYVLYWWWALFLETTWPLTPFSCSPSSLQPTVLGHHCRPLPLAVPGPDLRSQHLLRHQRGELGPPHPPPLTWRPAVPAVDTGFPSFSHISMGLGAPVALQVSRTGLWSSTGPGRLGGSVMRGGTAE